MKISIIKEQKEGEARVAEIPENVKKLVDAGNEVFVEKNAGVGCGYPDQDFIDAGATIVSHKEGWDKGEVIVKSVFAGIKKNSITWDEAIDIFNGKTVIKNLTSVFFKDIKTLKVDIKNINRTIRKNNTKELINNNYLAPHIDLKTKQLDLYKRFGQCLSHFEYVHYLRS